MFLFTVAMIFHSCNTLEELSFVPREEKVFGIDFSKYTKQDFLITPEKYIDKYESIGLITYEYLPATEYKSEGSEPNPFYDKNLPNSSPFISVKQWYSETVEISQVMDSVYKISKNMGADAIVNFDIKVKSDAVGVHASNPTTRYGYTISGFAIKRLK